MGIETVSENLADEHSYMLTGGKQVSEDKVVLLDIDGVIAPVYSVDRSYYMVDIQWTRFVIPVEIANIIKEISDDVETIWISSWEESSNDVSRQLDLNIDKFLSFPHETSEDWFKIRTLRKFIMDSKSKKILLIDDEICDFIDRFSEFENLTVLCPDDRVGLTNEEMNKIQSWIES